MFDLLFLVSIVGASVQAIKESYTPAVPMENWANKELYHKDIMDGIPIEQRIKNLKNGKYKLTETDQKPDCKQGKNFISVKHNGRYSL